jgi:hypothetical protein
MNGSLYDVDIFAVGEWNGYNFTPMDLQSVVDSFNAIGDKLQPYLKLGHNEEQLMADGYPSLGWVKNLRINGTKLQCDFVDVPKIIRELVDKRAYKRVSCEFYKDFIAQPEETGDGKKLYSWVLRAVALLGGDTPAVTTLQDIINLYSKNSNANVVTFEIDNDKFDVKEGEEMKKKLTDDQPVVEDVKPEEVKPEEVKPEPVENELEAKNKELEGQVTELSNKLKKYVSLDSVFETVTNVEEVVALIKDKDEELVKLKKDAEAFRKQQAELKQQMNLEKINKYVADGKVLPNQVSSLTELSLKLMESKEVVQFKQDIKGVESVKDISLYELLFNFIDNLNSIKFGQTASTASVEVKLSQDEKEKLRADLVEKYKVEFCLTGTKAIQKLKKDRPELYTND